jgi:phospholipid transport system substrate-binding protein
MRPLSACLIAVLAATAPAASHAQAADPAASQIARFDEALLDVMKEAKRLGPQGRFQKLQPVITQTFDLPTMTRFAVGPTWSGYSPTDQASLVRAFSRMTVATYAHNFDGYSGERFTLEPQVETRGPDKLVRTHLTSPGSDPVSLTYRMRQAGGTWKIIDVYYKGTVSSLMGQRSEYAATLRSGGAAGLIQKLDSHADELVGRR